MFPYHLFYIFLKKRRGQSFITVIHCLCFIFFGFFSHASETKKIATRHFSILFDKSGTGSAQRVANMLEIVYKPICKTLGIYPHSTRVILNNKSALLNASFQPLPRYISLYTLYHSDPYFVGNTDWLNMVSIHEFRHAVQHSIQYHSTPIWLRPLYFWANVIAVCGVNSFFLEGDAVGIETALSKSGRGRLPGWEKVYKVNLLERGEASLGRQLFGSLKYEMPSEYHIGYYFTTHIRRKYGPRAIQSIFEKTVQSLPYFGFYHAIKKVTKKSILKVYKEMNQELLFGWQKQLEGLKVTPATQLTIKKPDDSFDYMNPFMDKLGNLIACKEGIGLRDQLVQVKITPSASKKIGASPRRDKIIFHFIQNNSFPPAAFAIGEGCAAWLEACQHPWKRKQKTTRLQYYDFKKRKRRTLVSTTRYAAVAMSPSTDQLVVVETDKNGKHLLVILETKSGKVVKRVENPDKGYYLTPSWSDEDHIVVVKTKEQKNTILRINVATSKAEVLLPYSYEHRSYPKIYKDYLLYNSPYNGIDSIYAMYLPTKACFQVTSRKYGAYLGMVDPITNKLIFNDYTKNGMDIAVMPFDPLSWTPLEKAEDRSVRYYEPLVAQENNGDVLEKIPNHIYPLSRYNFAKDTTAFIGPAMAPNWEDRGAKVEPFSLINLQETFKATPYFYQNFNISNKVRPNPYKTTELGLKVRYRSYYPVLKMDIKGSRYKEKTGEKTYTGRFRIKNKNSNLILLDEHLDDITKISWTPELNLGIKLPYYFTLGSSSGKAYLKTEMHLSRLDTNKKMGYTTAYTFNIKNSSTLSKRDLYEPWSQQLTISFNDFTKSSSSDRKYDNTLCFNAIFYTPGIGNHHYFKVNPIVKRSAYKTSQSKWKQQINLTYGSPLAYPECAIPLIWFLERISMEGYCNSKKEVMGKQNNISFNAIGTKLCFLSRVLSNTNIPRFTFSMDFCFLEKPNNKDWKFQLPLPTCSFEFDVFNRRKN